MVAGFAITRHFRYFISDLHMSKMTFQGRIWNFLQYVIDLNGVVATSTVVVLAWFSEEVGAETMQNLS